MVIKKRLKSYICSMLLHGHMSYCIYREEWNHTCGRVQANHEMRPRVTTKNALFDLYFNFPFLELLNQADVMQMVSMSHHQEVWGETSWFKQFFGFCSSRRCIGEIWKDWWSADQTTAVCACSMANQDALYSTSAGVILEGCAFKGTYFTEVCFCYIKH